MRTLKVDHHPDIDLENNEVIPRKAARGIIVDGDMLLVMYTKKYNDFSLPGGGIDVGEELLEGLIREVSEETGAQQIQVLSEFGVYEELIPHYRNKCKIVHQHSYIYVCKVIGELGEPKLESYEINNGMRPLWVKLSEAISHNRNTILHDPTAGLAVRRELFLFELIQKEILGA